MNGDTFQIPMQEKPKRGRPRKLTLDTDTPKSEQETITSLIGVGRERVQLPDLPDKQEVYVRNRQNSMWTIASGDEKIPELVLLQGQEKELPDSDFWIRHTRFRELITDQIDAETGFETPSPLEVYRRTTGYKREKSVPANVRCDDKYLADVHHICYGPYASAIELIDTVPETSEGRINVSWLVTNWLKVLQHASWQLLERRRCGYEVDQRRLDALKNRIDEIDEKRRRSGIGMVYEK